MNKEEQAQINLAKFGINSVFDVLIALFFLVIGGPITAIGILFMGFFFTSQDFIKDVEKNK